MIAVARPVHASGSHTHSSAAAVVATGISYAEALRRAIEFNKAHPHEPTIGKPKGKRRR
jgi:hypothetical protein